MLTFSVFVLSSPRIHEASVIQAAEQIVGMNEAAIDEASRRIVNSKGYGTPCTF